MLLIPGPAWGLGGTGEPGAPITHLPLRSPGGKGVCWSWRRRAAGLRRSHFSHQKQLRFPGPPSCPLPGAVSPQEQQRGRGWAPRAPSRQRGAGWQSRVPSAVFMQTLQNLLANEVGTCVPWDFLPGFGQPHLSGTRGHLRGDRSCSDSPSSHPHVPHPAPAKEKLRQSGTDPSPLALEFHRGFGRLDVPMEPPGPGDTCDPWRWLLSQPRLQRGTQRWDRDTKSWRDGSGCSRPTQSPWS